MLDNSFVARVGSLPGSPVKDYRVASARQRRQRDNLVLELKCRVPLILRQTVTKQGYSSVC